MPQALGLHLPCHRLHSRHRTRGSRILPFSMRRHPGFFSWKPARARPVLTTVPPAKRSATTRDTLARRSGCRPGSRHGQRCTTRLASRCRRIGTGWLLPVSSMADHIRPSHRETPGSRCWTLTSPRQRPGITATFTARRHGRSCWGWRVFCR